jgi:hypothetical protein
MWMQRRDTEALSLIFLHVEPHVYTYVRNYVEAKEAWDELAKVFEDKGVNCPH